MKNVNKSGKIALCQERDAEFRPAVKADPS